MTCPHCNGTGEIRAPGWDPVSLGWTSFFGSPGLSGVPLIDHRAWLASQMAQAPASMLAAQQAQVRNVFVDVAADVRAAIETIDNLTIARALAETGHLGEAP